MWPALHMLGTSWYPPLQRTGYVSCYSTVALGQALAGLAGAPLVRVAGRDALCYVLTCLSLLWFLAWLRLVRDAPANHPRVSEEQRARLHDAIGPAVAQPGEVAPLPWRQLLLSVPVWACAVANLGGQWGQATLQLAVTKYLKLVYGFALTYDHVLGVLPPVGQCMAGLFLGQLADRARGSALVSSTTARKLLVYTSHFPAGAMLFVVGYSGCDPTAPAALYTAAVVISGATAAGVHASAIDVAPNYAGTVFGLSQTLGAAGGLAGSYVVTEALHGSLPGSWRLLFGVASLVLGLTATFFLGFGSGSVQPWNGGAPPPALAPEDPPLALGDLATPTTVPESTDSEAGPSGPVELATPPEGEDTSSADQATPPTGEDAAAGVAAAASPASQATGPESRDAPESTQTAVTLKMEAEAKTLADSKTMLEKTTQGESEDPAASQGSRSQKKLKTDISKKTLSHPEDQTSKPDPTASPKNTIQSHVSTSENAPGD
ncbi:Putative inorganic phosphate cotransporter [Gryllus bimaculatus]|nr:Putative inorganic phosphate cotransporter [Gryllus bimaculatus]